MATASEPAVDEDDDDKVDPAEQELVDEQLARDREATKAVDSKLKEQRGD